jgi:hypothetical protein
MIFLEFRETSKVIILQFQALISISLNAKNIFFAFFVESSYSKRGNLFSINSLQLVNENSFNKNHLFQKLIHKNGLLRCENSFIA